jgi:nucleoside 2-deoxyribosyltransferase
MKFYIGSSYDDRIIAKEFADKMEERGHKCTCKWWRHWNEDRSNVYCEEDIAGVEACEIFVIYNGPKKSPGKLIEAGMAIALGKPVYLFGQKLNTIFIHRMIFLDTTKSEDVISNVANRIELCEARKKKLRIE